jgi:hypothetical protein
MKLRWTIGAVPLILLMTLVLGAGVAELRRSTL